MVDGIKSLIILLTALLLLPLHAAGANDNAADTQSETELRTLMDKINYARGYRMVKAFAENGFEFDMDLFIKGMRHALAEDAQPLMSEAEMREVFAEFNKVRRREEQDRRQEKAAANKTAGERFLKANAAREDVVTLASGLQYKVLEAGSGPQPDPSDTVTCHYRGRTIDGEEFDSSYKRGREATFALNRVIKGWQEALQLMKVGAKWEIHVPPDLAYGTRGAGRRIGPNEVLIFEIELLGIQEK